MKRAIKFFAAVVILLIFCEVSSAVVRNGAIRGKNGLSYNSISYSFNSISVTIRNTTKYNVTFGGSMLFLDKNYKVLARAELLKAKIKRRSSRNYKAFFSEGTGEKAKNARYIEWEF